MSKPADNSFGQICKQLTTENSEVRAIALAAASRRKVKERQAEQPLTAAKKYHPPIEGSFALPAKTSIWKFYPEAKYSPTYIMRLVDGVEQWIRDGAPAEAQGHYYAKWLVSLTEECKKDGRPLDPALALLWRCHPNLQKYANKKGKRGKRPNPQTLQNKLDKYIRFHLRVLRGEIKASNLVDGLSGREYAEYKFLRDHPDGNLLNVYLALNPHLWETE